MKMLRYSAMVLAKFQLYAHHGPALTLGDDAELGIDTGSIYVADVWPPSTVMLKRKGSWLGAFGSIPARPDSRSERVLTCQVAGDHVVLRQAARESRRIRERQGCLGGIWFFLAMAGARVGCTRPRRPPNVGIWHELRLLVLGRLGCSLPGTWRRPVMLWCRVLVVRSIAM